MSERTNEAAGRYAAAVEQLAAELGLPCLNLWAAFQRVDGWQQRLLPRRQLRQQKRPRLAGMPALPLSLQPRQPPQPRWLARPLPHQACLQH